LSGCVLRLWGPHAELKVAVQNAFIPLVESRSTVRARRIGEASESDDSTFLYTVSETDGRHVPLQIMEVKEFLSSNLPAIQELMARPGISGGVLDFGWDIPATSVGQSNRFPLPFLSLCSEAGLEIEVSVSLTEIPRDG
jgi:hypothetical protein